MAFAVSLPQTGSAYADNNHKGNKGKIAQGGGGGKKGGNHGHSGGHGGNKGSKAALGIAAGLTALAIIANSSKAEAGHGRRHHRGDRCRWLSHRCEDGERWACRRLDRECGY
jgi:hypothetical protein